MLWMMLAACSLAGAWDGPGPRTVDSPDPEELDSPELIDGGEDPRPPIAGELVINEIMDDPDPTEDETGEWIELVNIAEVALALDGLELSDDDGEGFALAGSVAPGAFWLVAASADPADNGGIDPDGTFDSEVFHLENDADEVVLSFDDEEIDRVDYDGDFPARKGRSRALDPGHQSADDNDDADVWCDGVGSYGTDPNEGSPGASNPACP